MIKNQQELQGKIDNFLKRKSSQYPDLDRELTLPD
jgi:hypothetical protein